MSFKRKWARLKCDFGFHEYKDYIKVTGPKDENGIPVLVYQLCRHCSQLGNKVQCHMAAQYEEKNGNKRRNLFGRFTRNRRIDEGVGETNG